MAPTNNKERGRIVRSGMQALFYSDLLRLSDGSVG